MIMVYEIFGVWNIWECKIFDIYGYNIPGHGSGTWKRWEPGIILVMWIQHI